MKGIPLTAVAGLALLLAASAQAQKKEVTPTETDRMAVKTAIGGIIHPLPANTKVAASYGKEQIASPAITGSVITPFPTGPRYPADLTYQGGETVGQAQYHAIYVLNSFTGTTACTESTIAACWGNPEGFLSNLGKSDFIHVTDQYVGRYDSNRYTNGADAYAVFTPLPPKLTDADMQSLVHAVAVILGYPTGYGNIYHIFLPPGTDECFDSTYSVCYSPDSPNTFYFCAYHGSVTFTDIGHALYSVEPYQNVAGCTVPPGSPNGPVIDATNNVLSHETFETITDPDGTAWWNGAANSLYGSEIGDECAFIIFTPTAVYFNPSLWRVGKHEYATQPEYSNEGHTCTTSTDM
jgi:hypothetical protein